MTKTHTVRLTSDDIFTIGNAINARRQSIQALIDKDTYPVDVERVWREDLKNLARIRDDLLVIVAAADALAA